MIYFLWLSLGVVVEGAVLKLVLRRSLAMTALYALLINGITHPVAWWAVQSGTLGWLFDGNPRGCSGNGAACHGL